MDGVVFAIHGQQLDICLARRGHHDFARGDQDFLVRKRDLLAGFHGGVCRFQADDSHGRGDQHRGIGCVATAKPAAPC